MSNNDSESQKNAQNNVLRYDLTFSKPQKTFLILSGIIPSIIILLQIANIIFILINPRPSSPQEITFLRFLNSATPLIVMVIMSSFGILNFIFLLNWRTKVRRYNNQKRSFSKMVSSENDDEKETEFISFTELIYKNLEHMKWMRIILFISSIVSILYIWWSIRGLLVGFGIIMSPAPMQNPPLVLNILNITAQIVLITYFVYQWIFFFNWNKKLTKLELLEEQIINELDL